MYPEFASVADEEGFAEIAAVFRNISMAEKEHEKRYLALLKNIEEGKVFKKDKVVTWRCRNCGYVHEDTEAPQKCQACDHPQAYFEVLAENY
jgi:Rubrerythrin